MKKLPVIKNKLQNENYRILPVRDQLKAWRRANRQMSWGISREEFEGILPSPSITDDDRRDGFAGQILSYGFGDDGNGYSDAVLSGKMAWAYAKKRLGRKTWQCEYIDFDQEDHIRLRLNAHARPKGFYYTKFQPGDKFIRLTVNQVLKGIKKDTGCGPEGIQLLTVTHPHLARMMCQGKIPFMAFADYDVAPYGFYDFFDAMQMFCSRETLGLGIGNIDRNYPLFGIPTLRF